MDHNFLVKIEKVFIQMYILSNDLCQMIIM